MSKYVNDGGKGAVSVLNRGAIFCLFSGQVTEKEVKNQCPFSNFKMPLACAKV